MHWKPSNEETVWLASSTRQVLDFNFEFGEFPAASSATDWQRIPWRILVHYECEPAMSADTYARLALRLIILELSSSAARNLVTTLHSY